MKKVLYMLLILLATQFSIAAPILIQDSVETGPSYKDDVYYSLHTGLKHTIDAKNWDIAFEILGAGFSIANNGGYGVQVYHKTGTTAEDFDNPVVLSDVQNNWKQLYNSTDTWTVGAFNSNKDPLNDFDLGWGEYSMATHSVYGTTFYVIKTMSGKWKKIVIDDLTARAYNFRIANLDGTELIERKLDKNNYPDKNSAYYSIDNDVFSDREPLISDWDLHFSKYISMEGENQDTPYSVTGVRTNPAIQSIRVYSKTPETVPAPDVANFDENITNIGSNWKFYDGTKYVISDSVVFFLYRVNTQKTFRLVFNGFSGGSGAKGVYNFKKEELATSVSDDKVNTFSMALYPGIAQSNQSVNILANLNGSGNGVIEVVSSEGRLVLSREFTYSSDFNNLDFQTNNFSSGLYLVSIRTNTGRVTQKLIIQ